MNFSARQDILVGSTKWNLLLQWPFIWTIIVTMLVSNAIPIATQAASISGIKFVDSQNQGTLGQFDPADFPLSNQVIYLKSETAPSFVLPSGKITDSNGKYIFEGLSVGTYRVWQKFNPRTDDLNSFENAHVVTITNDSQSDSSINFPIPELTPEEQDVVGKEKNRIDEICNLPTTESIYNFDGISPTARVKINPGVTITVGPPSSYSDGKGVQVKALCNYGELRSQLGEDLKINATELIANYGSIVGETGKSSSDFLPDNYPDPTLVPFDPTVDPPEMQNEGTPGSTILLSVSTDVDGCITDSGSLFYNGENATIQAGQGGVGYLKGGIGGEVAIQCAETIIQEGKIIAGDGGEANAHQPEWDTYKNPLSNWDNSKPLDSEFTNNVHYYANGSDSFYNLLLLNNFIFLPKIKK